MVTQIVEGIDNEVLLVLSVIVAIVAVLVVQSIYSSSRGNVQNASSNWSNENVSPRECPTPHREEVNAESAVHNYDQETLPTESIANDEGIAAEENNSLPLQSESTFEGMHRRYGQNSSDASSCHSRTENQIIIRVKYMENERTMSVNKSITVRELKRLCFPDEMDRGYRVRLIYSGCLLQDDNAAISFYGVNDYSVIHTQISGIRRDHNESARQIPETDLDMSKFFLPLLGIILIVCWYGVFYYRQLFSVISIVILVFVTLAYGVLANVMLS